MDFILLSATNSKYKTTNKYRDAKIPLMCLEGLMADTLKMAGRHRYVDYGEHGEPKESEDPPEAYLEIVNSNHPMAAGLKNGYVKFIKEADVLKWATPPPVGNHHRHAAELYPRARHLRLREGRRNGRRVHRAGTSHDVPRR